MATIHANSAEKALHRFANLVMRSHAQSTFSDTEAEIAEAVDFVVHVERQPGRRVVREVLALRGYDRDAKRFLIDPRLRGTRPEAVEVYGAMDMGWAKHVGQIAQAYGK
jgi:pilus assembly protein CpaF